MAYDGFFKRNELQKKRKGMKGRMKGKERK